MGSNYYYRYNICEKCGRYDVLHLGNHSMGVEFLFQGYRGDQWKPPLEVIKSWDDWAAFMAKNKGEIHYRRGIITLEDFLKTVTDSQHMGVRKEGGTDFKDNKGYWFCMEGFISNVRKKRIHR